MSGKFILETDRLILREFELEDARSMFLLNEDKEVMQYTGDPSFKNEDDAFDFLMRYDGYTKYGFGRWACILKSNNVFIGWCGPKHHKDYVDLGYRFLKSYWGKGYATEAARACLDYCFDELKMSSLVGRVAKQNLGSIRILEKLGMTYWKDGECGDFEDALYYMIEKSK